MKRKHRFDSLEPQQHKWKKEAHWKSALHEIQCFLPVKDVAEIVAVYGTETQHLLRFTKSRKDEVDVLTGFCVKVFQTAGLPYNAKTLWVKQLDGYFVQDHKRTWFMNRKDGFRIRVGYSSKECRDMAFHEPSQSLVLFHQINPKVSVLFLIWMIDEFHCQHKHRFHFQKTKERQQMVILNGNVVVFSGNDNESFVTVNIWSMDLKQLITDKVLPTHNWPLILANEIICSSSLDRYDEFYHFQKDGSFERLTKEKSSIETQYRLAGTNVYKIHSYLVCQPMKFNDPDLSKDRAVHSVQKTNCGVFIIGMFQRGISLEFSYRCYREVHEGELMKVQDKQDLFHPKVTHCLLLN